MNWTPRDADPAEHHTLVDGIPAYMHSPLRDWFRDQFSWVDRGTRKYKVDRMQRYDLASRQDPHVDDLRLSGPGRMFDGMTNAEKLRIIDWAVYDNAGRLVAYKGPFENEKLEAILSAGSSMWKVGIREGVAGLERRVPEGVQEAAEAAMKMQGHGGRLLSEAWHATYGLQPQPDLGYRKSIEAVEAVVLPLVMPKDDTATLGKAIGQMRAQADWKLPFIKEHKDNPSEGVVLGMMQALWSGHSDRHPGTASYIPSTREAAEAAVSLAVTLVNLFSNGGIARR